MTPDYAQRRRLAVAAAITAIAVPALFLFDSGDDTEQLVIPVVASVVADEANQPGATSPQVVDDPMGDTSAAFLQQSDTVPVNDPATIAIPRLPDVIEGKATFSRDIVAVTSCQVAGPVGAPLGVAITITNRDNSRSVRCINDIVAPEPDYQVVLHPDAFAQIGDLTDAPVPVTFSW